MRYTTKALTLALALGLAGVAHAQDSSTTSTTDKPAAAPATPAPAAPAPAAPAANDNAAAASDGIGQPYVKSTSGDWQERCVHAPKGQDDPCQLYQLLKDGKQNPVAEMTIFPLPKGAQAVAGASIVTPLETLLTQQVTLQIDNSPAKTYPFTFCAQRGCVARVGFTQPEVDAMKKGSKIVVQIVPAASPEHPVDLDVSLKGFTNGYEALPVPEAPKAPAAAAPAKK
ncbi:invasion associated locus B family protein [Thioclava sp. BHET1]|nr:invasion associated locus B family protein [Thioclava sp. BHET1]